MSKRQPAKHAGQTSGSLDPYESLAAVVIQGALRARGVHWLGTRDGRWWCDTVNLDPAGVARGWLKHNPDSPAGV